MQHCWELLPQGMGVVRAELAGAMFKCTFLSFPVPSCFDRNFICCVWCFPASPSRDGGRKGGSGEDAPAVFYAKKQLKQVVKL